jgi:hypothetical protein
MFGGSEKAVRVAMQFIGMTDQKICEEDQQNE